MAKALLVKKGIVSAENREKLEQVGVTLVELDDDPRAVVMMDVDKPFVADEKAPKK